MSHSRFFSVRRFFGLVAPRNRLDFAWKMVLFVGLIHGISLVAEYMLSGKFNMPHVDRLIVTCISAIPFCALGLVSIRSSHDLQNKLFEIATTDMLTGLPNRRAFIKAAQRALDTLDTQDGNTGTLLLMDADHFKRINDTWGHNVGDDCLCALADRLRLIFSDGQSIARIGGEEFAAFLPGSTADIMQQFAAELTCPISVQVSRSGEVVRMTLSIGAVSTTHATTLRRLMHQADIALYQAKSNGRARIEVYRGPETEAPALALVQ